jgi:hypothetical protein
MPTDAVTSEARTPEWRVRAAVLSVFDIDWIVPISDLDEAETAEFSDFLADSCERVLDEHGLPRWQLRDDLRAQVLRTIGRQGLGVALIETTGRPDSRDRVQAALERFIAGKETRLDELDSAGLSAELQVEQWVGNAVQPRAVTAEDIKARLDWLAVSEPLQRLLARGFVGRQDLLAYCRYVIESGDDPLLIEGVGGIGKSSVLAQLTLNPPVLNMIAVYLSLDRGWLVDGGPQAIFDELLRQIGTRLSARDRSGLTELRQEVQRQARRKGFRDVSSRGAQRVQEIDVRLLRRLRSFLEEATHVLVILDTTEELARRDESLSTRVLGFLDDLSEWVPNVRIVAAGRSMPNAFAYKYKVQVLRGLTVQDALALMRKLTVRSSVNQRVLREIIKLCGGNPLSLHLAADVLNRAGDDPALALSVTEDNVQGQLYSRLLEHIRDDRVRAIAHPGLVVRRITPEIIRDVLAEPCGIAPLSRADAEEVFRGLRREATLCEESGDGDGALVHRQDVRAIMLPAIRRDRPGTTKAIHEAAVSFYEAVAIATLPAKGRASAPSRLTRTTSDVARREELYHRLMLDQSSELINERWVSTAGKELAAVIDEMPVHGQVYVASKMPGLRLDPAIRAAAGNNEWQQATRPRALSAMEIGQPAAALALVTERRDADGSPLLPDIEVEALERLSRVNEARSIAVTARKRATRRGDTDLVRTLISAEARINERLRQWEAAWGLWQRLCGLDRARRERTDAFDEEVRVRELIVLTSLLRVARHMDRADQEVADIAAETAELAERTPDRILVGTPALLRDLAAEIGDGSPAILSLASRFLGEPADATPETDAEVQDGDQITSDIRSNRDAYTAGRDLFVAIAEDAQDYLYSESDDPGSNQHGDDAV